MTDDDHTTLLLKGPWGTGKTSAIRSLLDEAKDRSIPDRVPVETVSFISLAGLRSIDDERSLFLRGFDEVGDWLDAGGKTLQAVIKGLGLDKFSSAASGLFLAAVSRKMKGALVVIDDIERRSKSLEIRDVSWAR
jgi:hypothetical protein